MTKNVSIMIFSFPALLERAALEKTLADYPEWLKMKIVVQLLARGE